MAPPRLIFVYAADTGLFNTLVDIAHKVISPQTYSCHLCALTHGVLTENKDWRTFVRGLSIPVDFLHRDEFIKKYPGRSDNLPAVFIETNSILNLSLSASEIGQLKSVQELIDAVKRVTQNTQ